MPAAQSVAWFPGRMSQPLSTREIWCLGLPRQAWASTTTGTIGRMRARVSSSCRARNTGLRRCCRRWRALSGGPLGLVVDQPGLDEELMGALAGLGGQWPVLGLVLADQFTGGGAVGRVQGRGAGFLGGGPSEPRGHGLALTGGRRLDRFLDLAGDRDRQFPYGHARHRSARQEHFPAGRWRLRCSRRSSRRDRSSGEPSGGHFGGGEAPSEGVWRVGGARVS